jgi:hypothetical protein
VPATSAACNRLLFFLFLLRPFTVLMKQTRQAVRAIKQSIFLDVYDCNSGDLILRTQAELEVGERMFTSRISKDDEVKAMLPSVTQI